MNIRKTTSLLVLLVFSHSLIAQSPGGVSRPAVWLKGNFSSEPGRLASLNFHPAVALDKSSTRLRLPDHLESLRRVTVFTVYQDSLANEERPVWEMTGDFGDLRLSTNRVSSESKKANIVFEKNDTRSTGPKTETLLHVYSSQFAEGSASKELQYREPYIHFGQSPSSGTNDGSLKTIAEFILYKKALNDKETMSIESYLALKYGITLKENYLNSSGKTVWDVEKNKRYSNNIAGIARDDQSSLYQKQSTSCTAAGQLTLGVDKIAGSNDENTGVLNDGDYLVWGDNGQSFRPVYSSDTTEKIVLSARTWLMKVTGKSPHTVSTEVNIDTKSFLPKNVPAGDFYLVIDRSATQDFKLENSLTITPESITDGIATFKNVLWDTDKSGKDHFAFGFKPEKLPEPQAVVLHAVPGEPGSVPDDILSFQVFPNPVSDGQFQVAIDLDQAADIQINIYDLSQHLVYSEEKKNQASYRFSGQLDAAPGAYVFQVLTPKALYYRMIVLQ